MDGKSVWVGSRDKEDKQTDPAVGEEAINEKDFQRGVIQLATLLGYQHYHTLNAIGSDPGFLDLVLIRVVVRNRFLVIELKGKGGNLTGEQVEWLEALRACGIEVWVLWAEPEGHEYDEAEKILRG